MASSLPEMHLLPTEFQAIIDIVKKHDRAIAARLDEAYHSASFNVTDNAGPVCFMSHTITHKEAASVQEWLLHEETKGDTADEVKYFGHLADQWRPISGEHL
ncbi:MAG: hypothetical protein OQK32_02935 [Gammaproteobacteria bacterium]|nr:hypothetical protein [Gammaproteobacteria bacterium]MCW8922452.1 hypothetical protein [Gammaproteobacteria bacterium]